MNESAKRAGHGRAFLFEIVERASLIALQRRGDIGVVIPDIAIALY